MVSIILKQNVKNIQIKTIVFCNKIKTIKLRLLSLSTKMNEELKIILYTNVKRLYSRIFKMKA